MPTENSHRIQTSLLNAAEKKTLVWLAERQPKWMVSDTLTYIGTFGAIMIAAGYALTWVNIHFLWLSCLGFVVNWYGDSLDGTLARVRKTQRPVYGYYLDHTMDCINEAIMFVGLGLSPLMNLSLALMIFAVYLCLTVNVAVNAHLRGEFKLTYMGLGPTELRIAAIIANIFFIFSPWVRNFSLTLFNKLEFKALDIVGAVILIVLSIIYIVTVAKDAKIYAKIDPMPKWEDDK